MYCWRTNIENKVGDMIKIGRRGSLSGNLTIIGKRGHVAYPNQAINPIHTSSKFINDIINCKWDMEMMIFLQHPFKYQIFMRRWCKQRYTRRNQDSF